MISKFSLRSLVSVTFIVAAPFFAPQAQAQTWTGFGSIQYIEGGWSLDSMAVTLSTGLTNPKGCPVTNAGYATDPADPGHNLFHTIALAAFLNRKEVQLLISATECAFLKPKMIAIGIH
jgi:hypothetical protein